MMRRASRSRARSQASLATGVRSRSDGVLIDGRNRLKTCEMAGVEPTFVKLNGEDPTAYIASANLQRRQMTAGQQAMGMALIYPDGSRQQRKPGGFRWVFV
jgi:hypothetical protein